MRGGLAAILLLSFVAIACAADPSSWRTGRRPRWAPEGFRPSGRPRTGAARKYEFEIVTEDNQRVLHMKSTNEASLASRDIKGKVNLKETPILEWSWKVAALPKGGDSCKKATDDQAVQVYVVWPRFPEAVRSRILGYVWDTTEPVGTVCKSEKTGTVTYFVIRSGTAELGKWLTERRNVCEDYKKVYNEDCEPPAAVSVAIDSNDTGSSAESYVGAIFFKRP